MNISAYLLAISSIDLLTIALLDSAAFVDKIHALPDEARKSPKRKLFMRNEVFLAFLAYELRISFDTKFSISGETSSEIRDAESTATFHEKLLLSNQASIQRYIQSFQPKVHVDFCESGKAMFKDNFE